MNRRLQIALVTTLIAGAIFAYFHFDFGGEKKIHIMHRKGPIPGRWGNRNPILFMLDKTYPLTSVKVVNVADELTNKYPHAYWHLMASNYADAKEITYGFPIRGMHPEVPKTRAEPLQPDVDYKLIVEAGKWKGEYVFQVPTNSAPKR